MPLRPLKFSGHFGAQVGRIVDFYDRDAGEAVAKSFLQAVKITLDHIAENPNLGSRYEPIAHRKIFGNLTFYKIHLTTHSPFPYSIFYHIEKQHIMVHVIHHQSANHDHFLSHAQR